MSTAIIKRPLAQALADAESLRAMFPPHTYKRWEFAGSIRRRRPEVGDIDHIIEPAFGEVDVAGGLFAERENKNLVFHRLDELVRNPDTGIVKHFYGASGPRWGELHRGIEFRGLTHELRIADAMNWGMKLAIGTGPAEFSVRLVMGLRRHQLRNHKPANGPSRVWQCEPCAACITRQSECGLCDGTGLVPATEVPAPDERTYFNLCGIAWLEPEARI